MGRLKSLLLQVHRKMQVTLATILYVIIIFVILKGTSVGEGTFGKVKLGKHILTGEKVS